MKNTQSHASQTIKHHRNMVLLMIVTPLMVMSLVTIALVSSNQRSKDTRAAASVTKAQVISYLQSLSNSSGSSKKLIAGQHVGQTSNYTQADRGTVLVEDMASRMNGEYVGMIGADLGGGSSFDTGLSNYLIDYWNKGGLITVSWHRKNPATGGTEKDTATNPIPAILSSSSSTTKTEYYKQLDTAAASLKKLQDNGVIVLYRPFHEMTINAFWWGCRDQNQYKQLWQTEYNYLTNTKGLSNLVWVWNPHRSHSCTNYPHLGYYPGSQYVDVVGADAYECINATTKVWGSAVKTLYDQLVTLGKPVAFPEVGESRSSCRLGTYTDYRNVFNSIKNNYPKVAYFIVWNADMSYKYNDQQVSGTWTSRAALQNSYVVNRGEHSIFNTTTPTPTPPTPTPPAPTPTPPAPTPTPPAPTPPPPPPAKPAITLNVTPATVNVGQSTTINWSATNNPTNCTASGDWSGSKPASGSQSSGALTTVKTYTYNLACTNAGGTTNATVSNIVLPLKPVVSISLASSTITSGQSTTINWSSTNSPASCVASGGWSGNKNTAGGSENTGTQTQSQTYTLTCSNAGGSGTASVALTVSKPEAPVNPSVPKPVVTLTAEPSNVQYGKKAKLTWNATNSPSSCKASGNWSGDKPASGSEETPGLTEGATYTLTCSNTGGSGAASVSVTVVKISDTTGKVTVNTGNGGNTGSNSNTPTTEIEVPNLTVDNPYTIGEVIVDPVKEEALREAETAQQFDELSASDIATDTGTVIISAGPIQDVAIPKPVAYTFLAAGTISLAGIGSYLAITKLTIFAGIRGRWGL